MHHQVNERAPLMRRLRGQRGIVASLVIYGLSVFSVLALTMITDPDLERLFRTSENYDLHVVLFGGRSDAATIVGRLNVPTVLRESKDEDYGIEIQIPVPSAAAVNTDFVPGSSYSVQLSPDVRVCCDTGDGACKNLPPDQEPAAGSVNRTVPASKADRDSVIQFDLGTSPTADNLTLDPTVATGEHFLVKALKEVAPDTSAPLQNANLMCTAEKGTATIASGTLSLQPSSSQGQRGPFTGKLQLHYKTAKSNP